LPEYSIKEREQNFGDCDMFQDLSGYKLGISNRGIIVGTDGEEFIRGRMTLLILL